jgi:hypothetical protein
MVMMVVVVVTTPPVMMVMVVVVVELCKLGSLIQLLLSPLRVVRFQRGDGIGNWVEKLLISVC